MTYFLLSRRAQQALERFVTCTDWGQELRRAQALLWLREGESIPDIAQRLRVSRQTV
jgi:hypothetical protein